MYLWPCILILHNLNPTIYFIIALCSQYSGNTYLYLFIHLLFLVLSISSFNSMSFFGFIFLLSENFLCYFFCSRFSGNKVSAFPCLKMSFSHLHFWRVILSRYRVLGWCILPLSTLNTLFHCLCTSILPVEMLAVHLTTAPLKIEPFLRLLLRFCLWF